MESERTSECPAHGPGANPAYLVGRHLEHVVASWHQFNADPRHLLDIWLLDSQETWTHISTGSDWCLIVDNSAPYQGYDMREYGRVDVMPATDTTPFARHVGHSVLAVREEYEPLTGRTALEIVFANGQVRNDMHAGDLRLSNHATGTATA